jgi:hypothetical protein
VGDRGSGELMRRNKIIIRDRVWPGWCGSSCSEPHETLSFDPLGHSCYNTKDHNFYRLN